MNPYQSPLDTTAEDQAALSVARKSSQDDDDDPISVRINIPAFGLSATTWMKLVFEFPVVIYAAVMTVAELYNWIYFDGEPLVPVVLLLASAAAIIIDLLILQGANSMLGRRRIDQAKRAALLAFLPTSPIFFLQVPFGIWSLRVLHDPQVEARFTH